jgi:hypothetical protein
MKLSIIAPSFLLLNLTSAIPPAEDSALSCRDKSVYTVVQDFYVAAGSRIIDLENELNAWPKQCGGISVETVQRAIDLQQNINTLANTAAASAACAHGYTVDDLKKKIDWITAMTVSFISAMKGWDNAREIVKAAGQEQAVLSRLRDLKENNDNFRITVELAIAANAWSKINPAVSGRKPNVWMQIADLETTV